MSDATKMATVIAYFGVEIPMELDLDDRKDYGKAMAIAARDMHQRGYGEMLEVIDNIEEE